jgi:uncharacterized protein
MLIDKPITIDSMKSRNLSLSKVMVLIFVPTTVLTAAYLAIGHLQKAIPSLLLFFLLAAIILFPMELAIILFAGKKEFGRYSLKSAFVNQKKPNAARTLLIGVLLFGLAGILSVVVKPLESLLTSPISGKLGAVLPASFDWANFELLRRYPKNVLLWTCVVYGVFNVFVGPVVEELFFRGYLTSKISRLGRRAPIIMTVLFSLYHLWLPFQNLFRISAFLPAAYMAWKENNISIAILFHCLCNLVSTAGFILVLYSV